MREAQNSIRRNVILALDPVAFVQKNMDPTADKMVRNHLFNARQLLITDDHKPRIIEQLEWDFVGLS